MKSSIVQRTHTNNTVPFVLVGVTVVVLDGVLLAVTPPVAPPPVCSKKAFRALCKMCQISL